MDNKNPSTRQIDPESAEAFIEEKKIGERIKRLRLKRSMGLVEMGKLTGLSASFLSQLETGRVVPTLRNLARISMVFSKDLSYFFEPEPQTLFRVHAKSDRVRLPQSGAQDPTYYFESLAYLVPDRALDPYLAEFIPLTKNATVRSHVHPGSEFLYLLTGRMEIRHSSQTYVLEPGDSVYFDASTPHSYRCLDDEKATAIIVTQHQMALTQPSVHPKSPGAPVSGPWRSGVAAHELRSKRPAATSSHSPGADRTPDEKRARETDETETDATRTAS